MNYDMKQLDVRLGGGIATGSYDGHPLKAPSTKQCFIAEALAAMERRVACVDESTDRLIARLEPAMMPQPPQESGQGHACAPTPPIQLAAAIQTFEYRLTLVSQRLEDALQRLDL